MKRRSYLVEEKSLSSEMESGVRGYQRYAMSHTRLSPPRCASRFTRYGSDQGQDPSGVAEPGVPNRPN
ncbi:hypothetical protein NSND_62392 [Nitrospira sp. ND1]|nr:hypothetical protein NSND_62392 [Nitrospira sp. ND1]